MRGPRTEIESVVDRLIISGIGIGIGIGSSDDGGGSAGRHGAAAIVEVLGVADGVVPERDPPGRSRRRRGTADGLGLLG
jgi:hypothetical protein